MSLGEGCFLADVKSSLEFGSIFTVTFFYLLSTLILHSQESEMYRCLLNGISSLAWELPYSEMPGLPVSNITVGPFR